VALKVLRPELAAVIGAERFLAEIRTTANLQHPHILPLFDSGQADSFLFYAMPLVEGESLRQRLAREGQLPVANVIRIATEVAGALDYAHRRGVIHRDIKPENILLHDGQALVADFGIALALSNAGNSRMTETGLSLGTPHYMSPEQAMGDRTVTARSDVYALGAITYEMLVGEPPFTGHSAQAIVARVLTEEPRRLTPQRKTVPAHVEVAVLTALQKLPADRFATAGEFASALGSAGRVALDTGERASSPPRRASRLGWRPARAAYPLAFLALAGLAGWQWLDRHDGGATPPLLRASLVPPLELRLPTNWSADFSLSPDGSRIAYVAVDREDRARLWVQRLDENSARLLEGAEDARHPFWSPDGRSLGFFAGGEVRTIPAAGGVIRALAKAPIPGGGAWGPRGLILFATEPSGIVWKVPAQGGTAEPVTVRGNGPAHYVPQFLPDGRRFLYTSANEDGVYLGDLETGRARLLRAGAKRGIFLPPDLLLYADGRLGEPYQLMAQHFDPSDASLHGEPTILVERLFYPSGYPAFTVSGAGLLVYQPFPTAVPAWQIVSRTGEVLDSVPRHGAWWPRFSHNGGLIAKGGADLWVHDLGRGLSQKLPSSGYAKVGPVWSPDDRQIAYWTRSPPDWREVIRLSAADGSADDSLFAFPFGYALPVDWSPDGRLLLVVGRSDSLSSRRGLWLLDLQTRAPRLWLTVDGSIGEARFSPDGRWLAYSSDETGSFEIYLRPFPGPGGARRVSVRGGASPSWRADGRELYYTAQGNQVMRVMVSGEAVPALSSPRPWGVATGAAFGTAGTREVTRDGEGVLLEPQGEPQPLLLIQGWTRLLPEAR
jgi:serine/threonine-protein kinase